jgi:type III secretion protein Y
MSGHAPGRDERLPLADEAIDLLHCLGFVYLRHGQARRASVLLMLAAQEASERTDVLRTLAAALIAAGFGERACSVLDTIESLDPALAADAMMRLMRARALLLRGRKEEARTVFRLLSHHQPNATG